MLPSTRVLSVDGGGVMLWHWGCCDVWGYCYVWDAAMLGMQWCWGYYYVWDAVMLGML